MNQLRTPARKVFLLGCIIIAGTTSVFAQKLIPFLSKKGTYGFATETGALVVKPQFDKPDQMFEEEKAAVYVKKDGQQVAVLRNNELLTGNALLHRALPVIDYASDGRTVINSLTHLLGLIYADSIRLYHNKKTIKTDYLLPSMGIHPSWFVEDHPYNRGYADAIKFIYGAYGVWKAPGKLNFIDANLKELFSRDFQAGMIVDENYFIVAEGPERYAIADRKGKIRTPFTWHRISPSGMTGFFIVNNPVSASAQPLGRAGLMDAKGKLIIDTIYHAITPAPGSGLFIVDKGGKFGVLNTKGQVIIPIEQSRIIYLQEARCFQVGFTPGDILDINGKSILTKPFEGFAKRDGDGPVHYMMVTQDSGRLVQLFDLQMDEMLAIRDVEDALLVQEMPRRFKISLRSGNEMAVDLRDEKGMPVSDGQYKELKRMNFFSGLFQVVSDGLTGVINDEGRTIVPLKYATIQPEISATDTLVWARKKDGGFWSAYSLHGELLPFINKIVPSASSDPVIGIFPEEGGVFRVTFKDGRTRILPDSLKNWRIMRQYTTPEGGFVLWQQQDPESKKIKQLWLNHTMDMCLPRGFDVPSDYGLEQYVEATGLLTVYRIKANKASQSSGNRKNAGSQKQMNSGSRDEIATTEKSGPEVIEYDACGVINARGEWVVTPKQNVKYIALSHDLIAEIPINEKLLTKERSKFPIRLLAINLPGRPVIQVDFIGHDHFSNEQQTMLIGIADEDRRIIMQAYLHTSGKQLTPFHVVQGPGTLALLNLVTIAPENDLKKSKQQIIDQSGNVRFDLDTLYCPELPSYRNDNRSLNYFVVQRLFTPEQTAALESKSKQELAEFLSLYMPDQGIMDSTGAVVVPLHYHRLQIIDPYRYYSAVDSIGRYIVYRWTGEAAYAFGINEKKSNDRLPLQVKVFPDGRLFAADEKSAVVLSETGVIERELPYPFYSFFSADHPEYYLSTDEAGRIFWVNSWTGKAYKEM